MKEQEKVFRELKKVTRELIRCGLAEEYNYPVIQQICNSTNGYCMGKISKYFVIFKEYGLQYNL